MIRSFFIKFISFTTIISCVLGAEPDNTTVEAKSTDAIEKARQYVKDYFNDTENEHVPGLVVGVSVKGKQKWLEGFGVANIENNVSMTGNAVMQIGSISKSFTVALASRLMQEGKLDFDVPIRNYLSVKDFPDKRWNGSVVNITLGQLFQMTSGVPNGPDLIGTCLNCKNQMEHLLFMRDKELDFEPGTNFTYSNLGYELAGVVIESVLDNKTFDDAIREMIANVLKLNQTSIVDSHVITPHISSFYTFREGKLQNSGMWGELSLYELHAAGGIISTMTDLLTYGQIWLDAYLGRSEHFLKQSTVKSAWTPTDVSPRDGPYAMGWVVQNVTDEISPRGSQVVLHGGLTIGCRTILCIFPETEIIVAASANLGDCDVDVLVDKIADAFANVTQS